MDQLVAQTRRDPSIQSLYSLWRSPKVRVLLDGLLLGNGRSSLPAAEAKERISAFDSSTAIPVAVEEALAELTGTSMPLRLPSSIRDGLQRAFPEAEETFDDLGQAVLGLDMLTEMELQRGICFNTVVESRMGSVLNDGSAKRRMGAAELDALQAVFDKDDLARGAYRCVFLGYRIYILARQMYRTRNDADHHVNMLALLNALFPPYAKYPPGILQPMVKGLRSMIYLRLVDHRRFTRDSGDTLITQLLAEAGLGSWSFIHRRLYATADDESPGYIALDEQMTARINSLQIQFPLSTPAGLARMPSLALSCRHAATPEPPPITSSSRASSHSSSLLSADESILGLHPIVRQYKADESGESSEIITRHGLAIHKALRGLKASKLWPAPLKRVRKVTSEPALRPDQDGQITSVIQGGIQDIDSVRNLFRNPRARTQSSSVDPEKIREQLLQKAAKGQQDKRAETPGSDPLSKPRSNPLPENLWMPDEEPTLTRRPSLSQAA